MLRINTVVVSIFLLSVCAAGQSPFDKLLGKTSNGTNTNLSTDKISAGLKEALKVSTTKAVAVTGKPDGFLKNDAIKILLPQKLRTAGSGLRMLGMGPQLDELEVGMNRAAEQAAPQAKQIFLSALSRMSIDDARRILNGSDTAASDYFRDKTSPELRTAFKPIVHTAMQNVGSSNNSEP
jgi:hypothetical protein